MVYGTLAVLLARRYPQRHAVIGIFAAAIVLAIAATRVILGVHWPSDLVAGLAIGVIAPIGTVFAIDRCERSRSVQQ
jgi:membrane-associated phospholipid phosphatase